MQETRAEFIARWRRARGEHPPDNSHKRPEEVAKILAMLHQMEFDKTITYESIAAELDMTPRNVTKTYVPKWKEMRRLNTKNSIAKVDWNDINRIVEEGVNREHLSVLLRIDAWSRNFFGTTDFDPTPSYRELRWQSHVMTYADSISRIDDIWIIGQQLTLRDITAYYSKTSVDNADLNEWMGYAPWLDDASEQRYLEAIDRGVISPIHREYANYALLGTAQHWKGFFAIILFDLAEGKEHMLPSQQIPLWKEQNPLEDTLRIKYQWFNKDGRKTHIDKELNI